MIRLYINNIHKMPILKKKAFKHNEEDYEKYDGTIWATTCPNGHLNGWTGCDLCGCSNCFYGCKKCEDEANENLKDFLKELGTEQYTIKAHLDYLRKEEFKKDEETLKKMRLCMDEEIKQEKQFKPLREYFL